MTWLFSACLFPGHNHMCINYKLIWTNGIWLLHDWLAQGHAFTKTQHQKKVSQPQQKFTHWFAWHFDLTSLVMLFGINSLLSTVSDISFFSAESRSRVLVYIAVLLQIYDWVRCAPLCIICMQPQFLIGHINEYSQWIILEFPDTQSMIAYKILTEYFWKFQWLIALWECC